MKSRTSATLLDLLLAGVGVVGPQPDPDRNACFGETHVHTGWSVDARVMGNRISGTAQDAAALGQRLHAAWQSGDAVNLSSIRDFVPRLVPVRTSR
jgi:hypothetical protein